VSHLRWLGVLVLVLIPWQSASAIGWRKESTDLLHVNRTLRGQVLDYTANHGRDHRIWSAALGQRRDLYVYLPPGFNPRLRYPPAALAARVRPG